MASASTALTTSRQGSRVPVRKFPGVDTVLGPEMRSTGEVMGLDTGGTQRYLTSKGVPAKKVNKVLEGRPHIVDAMTNGEVQLVFNTTEGQAALADSKSIRRAALMGKIPYYTTLAGSIAAAKGICAHKAGSLEVRPLQSYFG
jgi:carbamoyl-phosphate synthase large subunit